MLKCVFNAYQHYMEIIQTVEKHLGLIREQAEGLKTQLQCTNHDPGKMPAPHHSAFVNSAKRIVFCELHLGTTDCLETLKFSISIF